MRLLADMGRRVAADMGLLSAEPGLREGFALGGQPKQVEPGEQSMRANNTAQ